MEPLEVLLDTLDGLGVSVSLTDTGKIRVHPVSLCPGELLERVKNERDMLQLYFQSREVPVSPSVPVDASGTAKKSPSESPSVPGIVPVSPSSQSGHGSGEVSERVLALRRSRGQLPDGNYPPADTLKPHGCCGSCAHWAQFKPGDYHGQCLEADALGRHAAHPCSVGKWVAA